MTAAPDSVVLWSCGGIVWDTANAEERQAALFGGRTRTWRRDMVSHQVPHKTTVAEGKVGTEVLTTCWMLFTGDSTASA